MDEEVVNIPKYKKFWYSITKFERYPEMATEGVGRAFGYLAWLIFIFSVILSIAFVIKFTGLARKGINFLDKNFNELTYSEGVLTIDTVNKSATTDWGNVIVNTEELSQEKLQEYENKKSYTDVEIVWLKEYVILKYDKESIKVQYKDILENLGIEKFDKQTILKHLNEQLNSPKTYIMYFIAISIYLFVAYFIAVLLDVIILSLFGLITTAFAGIRIRYRALFNMAVYSITISTVLQLIYIIVKTFTGFNVKYFDLMHTAISFICLTASIFMIKSDVIKQQIELMRVIEIKKKEQEQEKEEEKKEEERKEKEKEEKKENNNSEENKKTEKKEEEENPPTVEGET